MSFHQEKYSSESWTRERQFYYTTFGTFVAMYSWWQVIKIQKEIFNTNRERRNLGDVPNVTID